MEFCAYLDIETTGLNPSSGDLTVIGIYRENHAGERMVQLVGNEITPDSLQEAVRDITVLYTYNGGRFDLPFIKAKLGLDLSHSCSHRDLMHDCWEHNLYGGLKAVERQLGIERELPDVNGYMAVQLWRNYIHYDDSESLSILLRYNAEDVMNLIKLRNKLNL